jgi:hypothetical protein
MITPPSVPRGHIALHEHRGVPGPPYDESTGAGVDAAIAVLRLWVRVAEPGEGRAGFALDTLWSNGADLALDALRSNGAVPPALPRPAPCGGGSPRTSAEFLRSIENSKRAKHRNIATPAAAARSAAPAKGGAPAGAAIFPPTA